MITQQESYYTYLDKLQRLGVTYLPGVRIWLQWKFPELSYGDAVQVIQAWLEREASE